MRNWFLGLVFALSCSIVSANQPERVEVLSSKVVLANSDAYFVLSDGSYWKVITFLKRWRSVSEWWNDVKLIPENYESVPNNWFVGTEIDVYPKYGNVGVDEANASNQEVLRQCTHLFCNSRNGQVLFAAEIHPSEGPVRIFNEGLKEGYSKGVKASSQKTEEVYNQGYTEGYKRGYKDCCEGLIKDQASSGNKF